MALHDHTPAATFLAWCQRNVTAFGWGLVLANIVLPIGIWLYALQTGKAYWLVFQGERNVITWFSSVQLVLVGVVAYGNFELTGVLRRVGAVAGRRWIWLLFGCAFVFLAIDERFEFHEFVRDQLLRPADVADDLPGIRSGDITMYVYLAVGLVAAGFLVEALRRNPTALVLFGSAVMLSVAFTLVDTLEHDITAEWIWPRFWTSAFEETAEIWAQGLFALSFLAVFRTDLQSLREQGAAS